MTTPGVSSVGFTLPTTQEIIQEWVSFLLANVDSTLDLSPDSPFGQLIANAADREALLWELGQTCYNSMNRDAAEGFLLEALFMLTGTIKQAASASVAKACLVNLNAGVTLPAGSTANVAGHPETLFQTITSVTNSGIIAASVPVDCRCTENGPTVANAGTLTVITAPVAGWNSITNPTDAIRGTLVETDTAFRIRQEAELAAAGATTVDAIRADMLEVPGIISAFVFENNTFVTDANGVPGKAIHVVIYDGPVPAATDADIAAALWKAKGSGVQTFGSIALATPDSTGAMRTVYFDRATVEPVYLSYDISIDPSLFPSNGVQLVKDAAVSEASAILGLGTSVNALLFRALPVSDATKVAGVTDVPALRLGFSAVPTGTTNLPVTFLRLAVIDTSRIDVNIV